MGFVAETRLSDSPYLEQVSHGYTEGNGSTVRPSEIHWHMVFTKHQGGILPIVVGPLTSSGIVPYMEGLELLWVQFKLGTFMPHMPTRDRLDSETILPIAAGKSFWLKSSAWEFPTYENVETFIERLVRDDTLSFDPVVGAALQGHTQDIPSRTLRHRFLRATGLTQKHIHQVERARQAAALLEQGVSILDTVYEVGYFDQPHLTRSLKQWIGQTPAQILRMNQPNLHECPDATPT
ncbi:MAG: helix-turn-helix domain-containing protein [Chloroflexota bacterium]